MKKVSLLILGVILLVIIFVSVKPKTKLTYETTAIQIGTTTITAEIADTKKKRGLGLSGRSTLPADRGMLFIFDQPNKHGFWMKDMNFPLDIVWFDKNRTIVGITKNLQPNSYPQIFYPPQEIVSALEINTGLISF